MGLIVVNVIESETNTTGKVVMGVSPFAILCMEKRKGSGVCACVCIYIYIYTLSAALSPGIQRVTRSQNSLGSQRTVENILR